MVTKVTNDEEKGADDLAIPTDIIRGPALLGLVALLFAAPGLDSGAEQASEPEIKAHISFPYDKGMARANVPVFGVAWAKDFESYRVEFGEGPNPEKWTLIEESTAPQPKDPWAEGKVVWNPDWGTKGNLATWETGLDEYPYGKVWKHNLRGLYMLRLVVKARDGRTAEHRIEVTVARVVTNWAGGYAESPDKLVSLHVKPDSLAGAFVLMSLLPSDQVPAPKDCVQIGRIYEFRPPDLKLLQPAKLLFGYGPDSLGPPGDAQAAISPEKLAILAYNARLRLWQPLASTVDPEKRQVWAEIKETPSGVAFYGLFADRAAPATPQLDPIGERVQRSVLKLSGTAEPLSTVVVSLNGEETQVASDSGGRFVTEIRPRPGQNTVLATCRDQTGNVGEPTPAQTFILEPKHPKAVKEIAILGGKEAVWGRKMLVKVVGDDASPETDVSHARIASSETDPVGFQADVVETGPNTGIYVALFEVCPRTDTAQAKIGARKDGEKIVANWGLDANIQASKPFRDRVPPGPPTLSCGEQQVLAWNSFERKESTGQEQWSSYGGEDFGPRLEVLEEQGLTFLRMRGRPGEKGHFGVSAWQTEYSVVEFPIVSFDCRILPTTEIDLLVNLSQPNVGWKGIRFTDDHPYYPRIGRFHGVVADLQWHRATVNLLAILRERFPGLPDYRVREIAFADWDGGERLFGTKHFGNSSAMGGYFDIDNFLIGATCARNSVTFRWFAEDESGIEGYSILLDDKPETVPPETLSEYSAPRQKQPAEGEPGAAADRGFDSPGTVTWSGEKTYDGLQDGQWWFHVRAKDKCGNWGRPNHYRLVVDTKPPELKWLTPPEKRLWFDEDIRIPLSDAGSGVDLDALELELDGRRLNVDGRSLAYDFYRRELWLRLRDFKPYPAGFPDGSPVSISLCGVRDYAGNASHADSAWTFTAGSPVLVSKTAKRGRNGWFLEEPTLEMHPLDQDEWTLAWMRSLKGDKHAERGNFIREMAVFPREPTAEKAQEQQTSPKDARPETPRFVVEVKVDKTAPETRIELKDLPPTEGLESRPLITLKHSEHAWRRGGLLGRYYRKPDFSEPIAERVEPFVYFLDDREQFTQVVPGATSATWEGAIHVPVTAKMDLELALWNRAPGNGRALIDGEAILELRPEEMASEGFKKRALLLTEGLHHLRLEYSEPSDRPWRFALFRWEKGEQGQDERRVFDAKELFYAENLGTTHYRWNQEPFQVYTKPFPAPPGKNVLHYYTVDQAGNEEKVRTKESNVRNTIDAELAPEGKRPQED